MGFNNGPKLVTQGLDLLIDAADPGSYPGSGTVWTDLRSGVTGSLTGSVTYTSEYYGGLTFSDSSSAVIFPGSTANYGSGSFTVEMAFKPTYIEGRHYLMAKNSGSFPNWAIYLSGSNGSGKLWSEWNIDASVSCSVSSSTTFETGSNYFIDVTMYPALSASSIYENNELKGSTFGNGGGSLTTTASLFVGNFSQNNTQNFSGSIYSTKVYSNTSPIALFTNYAAIASRLSNPVIKPSRPSFELLVVAGGGGGGAQRGGGGGAGGLQYIPSTTVSLNSIDVIVGSGGSTNTNGNNSSFGTIVSLGGGNGGENNTTTPAGAGGSGGGGHSPSTAGVLGGSGTLSQGNDGGQSGGASKYSAGGGGGAGQIGQNGVGNARSGNGGSGSYVPEFETIGGFPAGWFAGGGGGGGNSNDFGFGGPGGGGNGANYGSVGQSGTSNTGGGGGGAGQSYGIAGTGGSGIVAIRYSGTPIAIGGEITQSAGYTYHVYRTVGTSSFTIF